MVKSANSGRLGQKTKRVSKASEGKRKSLRDPLNSLIREKIREQVAGLVESYRDNLENLLKAGKREPETQWGWAVIVADLGTTFVLGYEHLDESFANLIME